MRWQALSLEARLAVLAVLLGVGALFADPSRGGAVRVDTRELGLIVEGEADHVTPRELADWIVAGRSDFRLIDLRDAAAYAGYHLPGAENVPVSALEQHGLLPNEKVVLYSDGGIHAAQAWFLLKARGYRGVYTLLGGFEAWKDEVLFPALPGEGASAEARREFEAVAAVARHFGGRPRAGEAGGTATAALELPKVEAPTAPAVAPSAPRRKKKEGC